MQATETKTHDERLKPSEEGSPEALTILGLLWRSQNWLTAETISAVTGLPVRSTALALIGLHDRGRIELNFTRDAWKIALQPPIKPHNRRREP